MKACHVYGCAFRRHGIKSWLRFRDRLRSRHARFMAFFSTLMLIAFASRITPNRANETTFLNSGRGSGVVFLAQVLSIQDMVLLPDCILLIIRLADNSNGPSFLPPREHLTCLFNNAISTPLAGLDYSRGRALIRCRRPGLNTAAKASFGSRSSYVAYTKSSHFSSKTRLPSSSFHQAALILHADTVVAHSMAGALPMRAKTWQFLVFEMWATEADVVVFAKGINKRRGHNVSPDELVCVYGDAEKAQAIETKVSVSSQEVFRCAHPPAKNRHSLIGKALTLRWGAKTLPTVAYYEELSTPEQPPQIRKHIPLVGNIPVAALSEQRQLCACNMIYNVAKFLPEWGTFHAHVGVDRFVFYDNNSDDDLGAALEWMADRQMPVARYPWPWPKTQEAGFSHCVLATRQVCDWTLFADVDEFVFPVAHLPPSGRATPLRELIANAEKRQVSKLDELPRWHQGEVGLPPQQPDLHLPPRGSAAPQLKQVGQISLKCRDFGPSNLTQHPARGVTQGYICRSKHELRHKSLVKTAAISADLENVVHHFNLLPEYSTLTEYPSRAVVNHYKYQAWLEFRQKFRRRVSAYVPDWQEQRDLKSQDRTPGLGASDRKPADWESSFCETSDTTLRDYGNRTFAVNGSTSGLLSWQI